MNRLNFLLLTSLLLFASLVQARGGSRNSNKGPKPEIEEIEFNLKPKNPMGFTVYDAQIKSESDLWRKAAGLLRRQGAKRNDLEQMQYDFFRYICFKARLERPQELAVSDSSLNQKFCQEVIGSEKVNEKTAHSLRDLMLSNMAKLSPTQAKHFIEDLSGAYNEAMMYRFSKDPEFLMDEVYLLLSDLYDHNATKFEEMSQAEAPDAWDYAGDAMSVAGFAISVTTIPSLVKNVFFNEILQGGASKNILSRMAVAGRKAWGKMPYVSPMPEHSWEPRNINGKREEVLTFKDRQKTKAAGACAYAFSKFAQYLVTAGFLVPLTYGLLKDEYHNYIATRGQEPNSSHPIYKLESVQFSVLSQLDALLREQRDAFRVATDAARAGQEAWNDYIDDILVKEKVARQTAEIDPSLSMEQNYNAIKATVTQAERDEMTKRFKQLAVFWAKADNTAAVREDPSIQPSLVAEHVSFLSKLDAHTIRLQGDKRKHLKNTGKESADLKGATENGDLSTDILRELLRGNKEGFESIDSLARGFLSAHASTFGFD